MRSLTLYQDKQLAGIKGITGTIANMVTHLPKENCPLLEDQLTQIEVLSHALSIMAHKLTSTINKE